VLRDEAIGGEAWRGEGKTSLTTVAQSRFGVSRFNSFCKARLGDIIIIIIIMATQPFVGPWPLFQFLDPINGRQDSLDG
jgi:hypothetical protein